MSDLPDKVAYETRVAHWLGYVAMLIGMIAALVGAGYLAAWFGGYLWQRGLSTITMKTNAALCLTLAGVALLLLVPNGAGWMRRWSARICAGLVLLVGLLTFVENLSGWNLGINQLLAVEAPGAMGVVNPNQMGLPASMSFTLAGLALLLLSRRDHRGVHAAQGLALAVCLIALLPTIGFLYGAEGLYGIARYTAIAWPTAVSLLLLGLGLLCARPAEGLMAQVTAGDPAGVSLRRLLPAFVILALLLGWLRLAGEREGLFDAATGTGIMMLLFIILFGGLTYQTARQAGRAAAALQQSEEKFARAFRSSPVAIAITRLHDGRILEVNEAILQLLHFTREEVIGRTTAELGIWVDRNERAEYIQRLVREGALRGWEHRMRTREGALVTVQLSADVLEIGGEPCLLATLVDLTERKRAEEELRESEAGLAAAQRLAHIGSWQWNIAADTARWSEETYRIFGVAHGPLQQHREDFLSRIVPEDRHRVDQALSDALSGAGDYDLDYRIRLPDGREKVIHAQAQVVRSSDGRPVLMHGTVQDITERTRAQESLQFTQFAVDHTADAAFWMTEDARLFYVNEAACQALGYSREELLRMTVYDIDPAFTESLWRESWRRLKAEKSIILETVHRARDGHVYPVEVRANYLEFGGRAYDCAFVRDITERRQAEAALRELNATLETRVIQRTAELQHRARQLQKLTLELSQVEERERRRIAVILHEDVQQQIVGARFHLGLFKNWTPQAAGREVLERVEEMLKDAIEKSRSLSHDLSPGMLSLNDLGEVLRWLVDRMQAQYGLVTTVDVPDPTILESEALTIFLFRAAQEMLFNVVKHARVHKAALQVRRRGRRVYLGVSDRGRGFDPQALNEAAGFGLLSIRERVELLGGRMKINSVKGRGSTLCLVVPDSVEPEGGRQITADGAVLPVPSSGPRLRVLLADDHEIIREGLASLLKETPDLEVVGEASNGHEAIDLACTLTPDVLIMDASLPVINGAEATRRVKQRLPEIRIVALSMHEDTDTIERMYRAGVDSYVLKTAPSQELLDAIRGGGKAAASRATLSGISLSTHTDEKPEIVS